MPVIELPIKKSSIEEDALDLFSTPEDGGSNLDVWSWTKELTPFTYMNPTVFNLLKHTVESPPPTYLLYKDLVPTAHDLEFN